VIDCSDSNRTFKFFEVRLLQFMLIPNVFDRFAKKLKINTSILFFFHIEYNDHENISFLKMLIFLLAKIGIHGPLH
jgi:hypothetical protein